MTGAGRVHLAQSGTAVLPSQPRYPRSNPGLGWVTRETLQQIAPDTSQWHWFQAVRLTDPTEAPAFVTEATRAFPPQTVSLETWQDQRESALLDAALFQFILTFYTTLLLIVSFAVVAILIGARATSQHREIGLLRAIGLTARQVNTVFVIEASTLALAGTAIGFVPGAMLAPRLVAPTAATFAGPPAVAANPLHLLVAAAAILPVVALGAFLAARRNTRASVLQALRVGTPTSSRSRLARLVMASRLPTVLVLGLRDALARRSRAIWLMLAVTVTGAAMVVTLSVHAALGARPVGEPSDVPAEVPALIFTFNVVLALVTVAAPSAVALLAIRERIRDFGVLRTIGCTPTQLIASIVGAQALLTLVASLLAIPAGIGLYLFLVEVASGGSGQSTLAPWWWLATIPIAMLAIASLAVGIPARVAARIPVADAVRYE
jgi:ABC-type antimicrobial peptide transport system permease subunit